MFAKILQSAQVNETLLESHRSALESRYNEAIGLLNRAEAISEYYLPALSQVELKISNYLQYRNDAERLIADIRNDIVDKIAAEVDRIDKETHRFDAGSSEFENDLKRAIENALSASSIYDVTKVSEAIRTFNERLTAIKDTIDRCKSIILSLKNEITRMKGDRDERRQG